MTGKLAGQIMETGFLSGATSRVLVALASVADEHGQSWYSYAGIAHYTRCSRKSAMEAVKRLELFELLHVERKRHVMTLSGKITGSGNLYTLNLRFFDALHDIAQAIRRVAPGDSRAKWQAVKSAAQWAEDQAMIFQWRQVIELAQHHPHVIKQACLGIGGDEASPNDGDQG